MRSRFANTEYEPTRSVDPFERAVEEMVRTGNAGMDGLVDDIDEEDDNRGRDDYGLQD